MLHDSLSRRRMSIHPWFMDYQSNHIPCLLCHHSYWNHLIENVCNEWITAGRYCSFPTGTNRTASINIYVDLWRWVWWTWRSCSAGVCPFLSCFFYLQLNCLLDSRLAFINAKEKRKKEKEYRYRNNENMKPDFDFFCGARFKDDGLSQRDPSRRRHAAPNHVFDIFSSALSGKSSCQQSSRCVCPRPFISLQ